jgi:hypothetical protein
MQNDPKAIFKSINLVYGTLFLGMIIFLVIASLLVSNSGPLIAEDPLLTQIFKLIVIGFTVVIIPIAYSFPHRLIKKIDVESPLSEKLSKYQQALTIRFALTEGVGIMTSIFFLLTGDTDLIMVLAIILLFYILSRPSPFKAGTDLDLSEIEKKQLFMD